MYKNSFSKYFIAIIALVFLLQPHVLVSQDIGDQVLDSLITTKKINVADITIKLSEADIKADIILNNLKNDKSLVEFKKDNDSIISEIKKDLKVFLKEEGDLTKKNNRRLNNSLVYWEQHLATIEGRISNVSGNIGELDAKISDFVKEHDRLVTIFGFLKDNNEVYSIQKKAKGVKYKVDKITKELNSKKDYSVKILEKLIDVKGTIIPIVDNINHIVSARKTKLTDLDHKSFFEVDYTDKEKWDLSGISTLIMGEYNRFLSYAMNNVTTIILHILMILLLVSFFVYLNKNPIFDITTKPLPFKLYYHKLLNMPVSLGVVMGLLSFVGSYITPPLVFVDVYRFLFVVPLFWLLINTFNSKFQVPVYLFFIAMIAQIAYTLIPEETFYSRILLFIVSILELWLVVWLILHQKKNEISDRKFLSKGALLLSYIYLIVIVVATIGNVIGMIVITEVILSNVISSILALIMMSLLLIVSNGVIISFLESDTANKVNSIRNNLPQIIKVSSRIANIIVGFFLFHLITHTFGVEEKIVGTFMEIVKYPVGLGSITFSLSGIFTFFFVIWMSLVISRIIQNLLEEDVLNKMEVEMGLVNTISMTVKYSIIAIGFFTAISAAGIPLNQMAIVFSAFGVGIGFGLQNIFNNLVSGFILLFERPIKIGDTVEVGTLIGQVKSIGIRSSKVRTFDGAEIIVPNGNLISNEVINWTLSDRKRRVEIIVGISYDSDPHVAQEIFMEVLKKHPHIVSNPAPDVYFRELGESSLDFRLLFWTFNDWVKVKSDIMFDVFDALKEAGIEIPFPQQDLHLRSIDEGVEIKHKSGEKRKL